ncbi:Calcineurin-like phosphoesterase [Cognatiyoonia koreensis]|uniref:Calcineurin-like phosphoesterase n=1 Tax=Cognatiyoonia koreensis TaxID=364200 RepID=A0A1I0RNI0_9RHOB|nr:metallophosphoesterase [Cognatiyoonia koreensis]SEW42801.1 Calcineurin-like phosphoesterase [Cognatiyoonia koreensis]
MLKYICISDLHCGAPTSLLMPPPSRFSADPEPVATTFAEALGRFLSVADASPQLILLGDILDLQFSNRSHAYQNAVSFLKPIADTGRIAREVIATAGNHDHALWTDARLSLEADTFSRQPDTPEYRGATNAFCPTYSADSRLLTSLIKQSGFKGVDLRYPNIGFANKERAVVLHHGHFIEEEYRLVTRIKEKLIGDHASLPTVEQIAVENAGWIDFFWSTTGDSGVGIESSSLYQNVLTSTGFRRLAGKLADEIRDTLRDKLPFAGNINVQEIIRSFAMAGLDLGLGRFRDTERYSEVTALTTKGYEGVAWYLNGPVKNQIQSELKAVFAETTFVCGHTHKPFAERIVASGFAKPVKTYNTGGWTLNGPRLDSAEGASMILIDNKLNVASVNLFSTPKGGIVPAARVQMLSDGPDATAFRDQIAGWLAQSETEWTRLAEVACKAYFERQEYLLDLTADHIDRQAAK